MKRQGEVHGSGRKPRPQKGTGRARLGNKRASGRYKGGKAFGPVPWDFTILLPLKVKFKGIISTLSAKLAEGKVIILDQMKLNSHKTQNLVEKMPK